MRSSYLATLLGIWSVSTAWGGAAYYLDCAAGNDASDGLSEATAWHSVRMISGHEFRAGDRVLLRRGTECTGSLRPQGSGTANAPIVLDAWGEGALPKIRAEAGSDAALRLFDQEYWTVQHLEFIGGQPHGILVSGSYGVLHGVHILHVIVHGVSGEPRNKEGGLVVIAPGSASQRFDDVLVDGVTAYGTSQWVGIMVGGVAFGYLPEEARSTNVTIRNSMVHDVAGDGIVLFQVNKGTIEGSIAWHTGMQPTQSIGTPNGIWTWECRECVVRRCEAFLTDSPGVDGGAFDIDYGNDDNIVEESYGHDTQGYCVAVFGAGGATTNSIVRRNVCVANGRSPRLAAHQGAVFLSTWNGGRLKGVRFAGNRIFWDPPIAGPAVVNTAEFEGAGASFEGDSILKLPAGASRGGNSGRWRLSGFVSRSGEGTAMVASAYRQFHALGLDAEIVVPGGDARADRNLRWDWNLGGIGVRFDDTATPAMILLDPAGQIAWRHDGVTPPGDLGLALRSHLGDPDYGQLISERNPQP